MGLRPRRRCVHCQTANFCTRHSQIRLLHRDQLKPCMCASKNACLCLPLRAEQLDRICVGIKLDVKALKTDGAEALFFGSLGKLLNDPSYRRNAQMVKRKFELTPFGPKQTLIQWVEFAAEFSELNELNLPGEDELGTLAYYSVDVLLFSAVLVAVFVCILFKLTTFVAKCLRSPERNKEQKIKMN
uniref:Glucuronosyltransferase n=1 Tax=Globodera pallida TaxID=36090 RepID=A0A183CG86_GLOPA